MANNRLYIRCKCCGEVICIGKHFLGALVAHDDTLEHLNYFYVKHCYCGDVHYSLELCEEFPGEMTDNNIDSDGEVVWFERS